MPPRWDALPFEPGHRGKTRSLDGALGDRPPAPEVLMPSDIDPALETGHMAA
jgi:hypothetical protein